MKALTGPFLLLLGYILVNVSHAQNADIPEEMRGVWKLIDVSSSSSSEECVATLDMKKQVYKPACSESDVRTGACEPRSIQSAERLDGYDRWYKVQLGNQCIFLRGLMDESSQLTDCVVDGVDEISTPLRVQDGECGTISPDNPASALPDDFMKEWRTESGECMYLNLEEAKAGQVEYCQSAEEGCQHLELVSSEAKDLSAVPSLGLETVYILQFSKLCVYMTSMESKEATALRECIGFNAEEAKKMKDELRMIREGTCDTLSRIKVTATPTATRPTDEFEPRLPESLLKHWSSEGSNGQTCLDLDVSSDQLEFCLRAISNLDQQPCDQKGSASFTDMRADSAVSGGFPKWYEFSVADKTGKCIYIQEEENGHFRTTGQMDCSFAQAKNGNLMAIKQGKCQDASQPAPPTGSPPPTQRPPASPTGKENEQTDKLPHAVTQNWAMKAGDWCALLKLEQLNEGFFTICNNTIEDGASQNCQGYEAKVDNLPVQSSDGRSVYVVKILDGSQSKCMYIKEVESFANKPQEALAASQLRQCDPDLVSGNDNAFLPLRDGNCESSNEPDRMELPESLLKKWGLSETDHKCIALVDLSHAPHGTMTYCENYPPSQERKSCTDFTITRTETLTEGEVTLYELTVETSNGRQCMYFGVLKNDRYKSTKLRSCNRDEARQVFDAGGFSLIREPRCRNTTEEPQDEEIDLPADFKDAWKLPTFPCSWVDLTKFPEKVEECSFRASNPNPLCSAYVPTDVDDETFEDYEGHRIHLRNTTDSSRDSKLCLSVVRKGDSWKATGIVPCPEDERSLKFLDVNEGHCDAPPPQLPEGMRHIWKAEDIKRSLYKAECVFLDLRDFPSTVKSCLEPPECRRREVVSFEESDILEGEKWFEIKLRGAQRCVFVNGRGDSLKANSATCGENPLFEPVEMQRGTCDGEDLPPASPTPASTPPPAVVIPPDFRKKWTTAEGNTSCQSLDLSFLPGEIRACGRQLLRFHDDTSECTKYSVKEAEKLRIGNEQWYQLYISPQQPHGQRNMRLCLYFAEAEDGLRTSGVRHCSTFPTDILTKTITLREQMCEVNPPPQVTSAPPSERLPSMFRKHWHHRSNDDKECNSLDLTRFPEIITYSTVNEDGKQVEQYRATGVEDVGKTPHHLTIQLHSTSHATSETEEERQCIYLEKDDEKPIQVAKGSCNDNLEEDAAPMLEGVCRQQFSPSLPVDLKMHWRVEQKEGCQSIDLTYAPEVALNCEFGPERDTERACQRYSIESVNTVTSGETVWHLLTLNKRSNSGKEKYCLYVTDNTEEAQTSDVISCPEKNSREIPETMSMKRAYCPAETPVPQPSPEADTPSKLEIPGDIIGKWHMGEGSGCEYWDLSTLPNNFKKCSEKAAGRECEHYTLVWISKRNVGDEIWYQMQFVTASHQQQCILLRLANGNLEITSIRECSYDLQTPDDVMKLQRGSCGTGPTDPSPRVSASPRIAPSASRTRTATPTVSPSTTPLPAPEIKNVEFDRFGTTVSVYFDSNTNGGGFFKRRFDCSDLIYWKEAPKSDPFRFCMWKERMSKLDIILEAPGADVFKDKEMLRTGSTLVLFGDMIRQAGGSSPMPETNVPIPEPSPNPQVRFALDYQRLVSVCSGNRVTTLYAQGAGRGSALSWKWELSEDHADFPNRDALETQLQEATDRDSETISLGKSHLAPGSEYVIKVMASNEYGSSQTRYAEFFTVDDRDLSLEILESSEGEVSSSDDISFGVRSDISRCGGTNISSAASFSFTYTWKLVYPNGEVSDTNLFVLRDPRKLRIPAGRLPPDPHPYKVNLTVTATSDSNRRLSPVDRAFEFKINPSPVEARIQGGDRSAGMNHSLIIDASRSRSPDDFAEESSKWIASYDYKWECEFLGQDESDKKCSHFLMAASMGSQLEIPPITLREMQEITGSLDPEIEFRVHVNYTVQSKTTGDSFNFEDSDRVSITLLPESPPSVSFVSIGPNDFIETTTTDGRKAFLVNSFDEIRITASVQTKENEDALSMKWEVLNGDFDLELEDGKVNDGVVVGTIWNDVLRIRPGAVTPGSEYVLRLKGYFQGNPDNFGFTDVRFVVNTPPRGGTIKVRPVTEEQNMDSAVVSVDEFVVEASGWSDENPPFTYRFSYTYGEDLSATFSWRGSSRHRSFRTKLPFPESSEASRIRIVCEIMDSLGARTVHDVSVGDLEYPREDQLADIAEEKLQETQSCIATKNAACGLLALRNALNAERARGDQNRRALLFTFSSDSVEQLSKLLKFISLDDVPSFVDTLLSHIKALQTDTEVMKELVKIFEDLLDWLLRQHHSALENVPEIAEKALAGISHMLDRSLEKDEVDRLITKLVKLVDKSELDFSDFVSLQPPFALHRSYCDRRQNLGIALQKAEEEGDTVVRPSESHGFGISSEEYNACDEPMKDTSEYDRVLPSLNIPEPPPGSLVILKEFAQLPPSMLPEGTSFSDLAQSKNASEALYHSLIRHINENLIPGGNVLSRSDFSLVKASEDSDARRELTSSMGAFADTLVGAPQHGRDPSVKTVDSTVDSSEEIDNGFIADVELPVYPASGIKLTEAINILGITSEEQDFPYKDITCESGEVEFDCLVPGGESKRFGLQCGSAFHKAVMRVFCPAKVVLPASLRMESGEWTDNGIDLQSFDGRKLKISSEKLGTHSASLQFVDVEPFGRVIEVASPDAALGGIEDPVVIASLPLVLNSLVDLSSTKIQDSISNATCETIDATSNKACSVFRDYSDFTSSFNSRSLNQRTYTVDVIIRTFLNGEPVVKELEETSINKEIKGRLNNNTQILYSKLSEEGNIDIDDSASSSQEISMIFESGTGDQDKKEDDDENEPDGNNGAASGGNEGNSQTLVLAAGVVGAALAGLIVAAIIVIIWGKKKGHGRRSEEKAAKGMERQDSAKTRNSDVDPEAIPFSSVENPLSSHSSPQSIRNSNTYPTKNAFHPTQVRAKERK
eukprot:gb/GECG01011501.1/.p1 GENE.gb/GECG01011501.1/~~gb/GECG01011501.1/.p1  ORF type:complete len:2960 (+),score=401.69 gb/GECG01011501.1/:1-8880(+)